MAHSGLPTSLKFIFCLIFTLALGACGGGGGSSGPGFIGGGGDDGDDGPPPDVTVELTLTNSNGDPTTNVTTVDPGRLDILVTDVLNGPVEGVIVNAVTTLGTFEPESASALTDSEGKATLFLIAGQTLGAGSLTVTVRVDDEPFSASLNFQVGQAELSLGRIDGNGDFLVGEIGAAATDLPAAGSTVLDVAVVDGDGDPVSNAIEVSFSSGCASQVPPSAQLAGSATTVNGIATVTYTAAGCVGNDIINAAIVGSSSNSASVTLTIAPSDINSISFVSATPTTLALKGTGGEGREETSTVQFKVLDATGTPVQGVDVSFVLSTTIGDLSLTNDTATTNESGIANAIVQAGNVSTSVRVTATLEVDGVELSTVSDRLVVTTGLPDQNSFSLSFERFNVPGGDIDGEQSTLTIRMADKFNNPVPDGTTALFTTEYGAVVSNCETSGGEGACTVVWTSQQPRLPLFNQDLVQTVDNTLCPTNNRVGSPCPDFLGEIAGRRSTVLVTAIGEESFDDKNGNGLWDLGEDHQDLPEAFLDMNENGVYDGNSDCTVEDTPAGRDCAAGLEERFVDFNENGVYDGGNGIYNGTLCPQNLATVGACSKTLVSVRADGVVIMSDTINQRLALLDAGLDVVTSGTITAPGTWYAVAADSYNNLPHAGATLSVESDSCSIVSETSWTVPSTSSTGAAALPIVIQDNPDNLEQVIGTISVNLTNSVGGDPGELLLTCIDPIGLGGVPPPAP